MKTQSAKGKGRKLQQWVRDKLLGLFAPRLQDGDVRSTSMGAQGEDVILSPAARQLIPFQIETKSYATFAVYKHYEQASEHGEHEPLLVIKANHKKPLVVMDAEQFFKLLTRINNES